MNKSDLKRNLYMLKHQSLGSNGYDWWWHSFTGYERDTKKEKSFFVEYFICNPNLGTDQPVLGQLKDNQDHKIKPSYVMIKVGCWGEDGKQINNFYPIRMFKWSQNKLDIEVGACKLSETSMKGKCSLTKEEAIAHPEYMSEAGDMSWDLTIDKKIAYNVGYGASYIARKLNLFEMFWHAEGIKTEYAGTVVLDGITYDVVPEKSYGYADKNWGKDFTSPWVWISSCHLTSLISGKKLHNSAIEVGGGRPKVLGISLNRKLLIGMYYEGKMYDFNFSKFFTKSTCTFEFTEEDAYNNWAINCRNNEAELELKLTCKKDEMIFIHYEAPNGKKLHHRLWNGGTGTGEIYLYKGHGENRKLIDHIKIENAGCEYGEY